MSTSQDIIVCEVCEIEPLQHFCNQCEVRLCNNCVISHLSSESVEGHTIVRYKYRDARNVKPRQCSTHRTENKTLFCKSCVVQICTKGLLEHVEHEITDLRQCIHSEYVDIDKNMGFLRTTVQPDIESGIEKLNQIYEEASKRYDQERQRMIDAEKVLHDKVTAAMKALLDEMETRRNETLTRLTDLKTNSKAKLQTIDQFIDKCEAAKKSVEDILTIKFDEGLLDMDHSVGLVFPQYVSPNKWTVDVGAFKSISTRRRIFEIDVENNIQLPIPGRVMIEKNNTEGNEEGDVFLDAKEKTEKVDGLFIENPDQQPTVNLLENCSRYKTELQLGLDLEGAQKEYQNLLKRTKEMQSLESVSQMQKNEPPSELNYVNEDQRREAPMLYGVISIVSEKCLKSTWRDAVREFITLTTYSKSEPQCSKNQKRPRSSSGYQKKKQKEYRNNIEKLLDQEWQSDFIPKSAVEYDYRHFFTSESVLRSSFPDAYIFDLANSKISRLEDVPVEFRNRRLCTFLETIDMKKFGVDPRDAWRDYGSRQKYLCCA
ncbi:uncharacterized protein LOC125679555 [Ostrea edulis]|uniref:uncharacterized protein LOC125679555 n=1 Tax=Ostrea edulis TaxID=37623 RepID=UPI0024AF3038|nr:uncharacterized protein LOC125679555 [Ostrea edulis]XP_048774824.2 uncharacterized protein LOC125679555 [Ostrea edulis]